MAGNHRFPTGRNCRAGMETLVGATHWRGAVLPGLPLFDGISPHPGTWFSAADFLLGAAFALRARKIVPAWLLAAPVFIVSAWLAVLGITQ